MEWTVAPIASNDPAAAQVLRRWRQDVENDSLVVAARSDARLLALHVFAPVDVLMDHERRRLLRLAASFGECEACEDSLASALHCAAAASQAHANGVCALVSAKVASEAQRDGFRGQTMRDIVFPVARRRTPVLDPAAAFEELSCATLARFDYHALAEAARRTAPVSSLDRNNNFVWGASADDNATFEARGCELSHPQLFSELLQAIGERYRARRVRFLCSAQSMLARAARGVLAQDSAQSFVYKLESDPGNIRFDAHAGLACSRH